MRPLPGSPCQNAADRFASAAMSFPLIEQSRFGTRTRFEFLDDGLRYSVKDSAVSASFTIEYDDIPKDFSELEEKKAWFRNVGILWIVIGLAQIGLRVASGDGIGVPFWLLLGLGCVGYHHLSHVRYRVYDTARGRILVIDDRSRPKVEEEIARRRAGLLKARYARVIDPTDSEREAARFRWLRKEGVISEDEFDQLMVELQLGIADKLGADSEQD